jgi:hypothetical protein
MTSPLLGLMESLYFDQASFECCGTKIETGPLFLSVRFAVTAEMLRRSGQSGWCARGGSTVGSARTFPAMAGVMPGSDGLRANQVSDGCEPHCR